jgi:UDP-galactopyranose mutase
VGEVSKMAEKKIIILGAGLAGLSAAYHLQKNGYTCQVFEQEAEVGGLCRSKHIDGFVFDYDGHLLHFKHQYTFNLIKRLLGDNLARHERNSWIYSHGIYSRYPFQANLHGLPMSILKECLLGFISVSQNSRSKRAKGKNFLDWIGHTFGAGIAKHFMVPYNTKFWTLPPEYITCEWIDEFIPVPSLNQVLEGTVHDSTRGFGYNTEFWYPKTGGISQLALAFAGQIGAVYTNSKVTEINLAAKEINFSSGETREFDYLISTIALPQMRHLVKGLPSDICAAFNKLRWNSIFNMNLGIEGREASRRHWVYFPEKELVFFRVGFPHNFSSSVAPVEKSSLYVEVSYSKGAPIDKSTIAMRIKEDLKKTGILSGDKNIRVEDVNDIHYGYPIYDREYKPAREKAIKFLSRHNIIPCGRYGSWRYMSIEDSILDGRDVLRYVEDDKKNR